MQEIIRDVIHKKQLNKNSFFHKNINNQKNIRVQETVPFVYETELDSVFFELGQVDEMIQTKIKPNIFETKLNKDKYKMLFENIKKEIQVKINFPVKNISENTTQKKIIIKSDKKNSQLNVITTQVRTTTITSTNNIITDNDKKNQPDIKFSLNTKQNPIILTMSGDPKIKPYDLIFKNISNLEQLENSKLKFFSILKTLRNNVELGDLIYRLAIKFCEYKKLNGIYNAIDCFENSKKIYLKIPNQDLRLAELYKNLSIAYINQSISNTNLAENYINLSIEIFKKRLGDNSYDLAECFFNKGFIYETISNYSTAQENYLNSLNIFKIIFSDNLDEYNFKNEKIILKNEFIEFKILKSQIKKEIGDCYLRIAKVLENLQEFDKAVEQYKISYIIYFTIENNSENNFHCASCFINIGDVYLKKDIPDKSLKYYDKALNIFKKINQEGNGNSLIKEKIKFNLYLDLIIKIAIIHFETEKYDISEVFLQKIIEEILITKKEDIQEYINLNEKNLLLNFIYKYNKDIHHYLKDYTLYIFEVTKILCEIYKINSELINFLSCLGILITNSPPTQESVEKIYYYLIPTFNLIKEEDESILKLDTILIDFLKFLDRECEEENCSNFHKEKSSINKIKNTNSFTNNYSNNEVKLNEIDEENNGFNPKLTNEKVGDILLEIALQSSKIGLSKRCIEFYSKSLCIYNAKNEKNFKIKSEIFDSIAIEYDKKKELNLALINFLKSLKLKILIYGKDNYNIVGAYNNIAIIYEKIGENLEALNYFKSGLDLKISHYGQYSIELVFSYYNIGLLYLKIENPQDALTHFIKVEEIFKQNPKKENNIYFNNLYLIADSFYRLKMYEKAIFYLTDFYDQSDVIQDDYKIEYLNFKSSLLIGICFSNNKMHYEAIEILSNFFSQLDPESIEVIEYCVYGMYELAKSYEEIGDLISAISYYRKTQELAQNKWSEEEFKILQKKIYSLVRKFYFYIF